MLRKLCIMAAAAAVFAGASMARAAQVLTYTYDLATQVGPSGTAMSVDGWTGSNIGSWITAVQPYSSGPSAGQSVQYIRDNPGADHTITRANDSNFSYAIPSGATQFTMAFDARIVSNGTPFFQIGFLKGGTLETGLGFDFGGSNEPFIITPTGRTNATSGPSGGDQIGSFELVVDTLANGGDGSGSLYFNNALAVSGVNMHLTSFGGPATFDGILVRTNSQYNGPGSFTITATVPTPAALPAGLGLLGVMGASVRRRRRS